MCHHCRYELERGLLDGSVAVADLPRLWNERMASYLGCTPADDAEGVLQVRHVWVSSEERTSLRWQANPGLTKITPQQAGAPLGFCLQALGVRVPFSLYIYHITLVSSEPLFQAVRTLSKELAQPIYVWAGCALECWSYGLLPDLLLGCADQGVAASKPAFANLALLC